MATTRGVIHATFHASGMERPDDKDPLEISTYYPPATIHSMLELRAFCAAFFEVFLGLICHSPLLFARARAVIPGLQTRNAESDMKNHNAVMRRVLHMTEKLRCRMCEDGEVKLIEESAWIRLANDGREQFERVVGNLAGAFTAGDSESWVPSCIPPSTRNMDSKGLPSSTSSLKPIETAIINNHSNLPARVRPPKPVPGKKPLKLENIPLFIPSAQLGTSYNVVWSPTTGSRPLIPGEVLESQTHQSGTYATFGNEVSGNVPRFAHAHTNLSDIKTDTPIKRHGRGVSSSSENYGNALLPRMPAASPFAPLRGYGLPKHLARNSMDHGQLPGSAPNPTKSEFTTRPRTSITELADKTAATSINQEIIKSPRPSFARMAGITDAGAYYASHSRPFNDTSQGFFEILNPLTHKSQPPHAESAMAVNPPYHSFPEPAHESLRHQTYDYERSNAAFKLRYHKSNRGKQRQTPRHQFQAPTYQFYPSTNHTGHNPSLYSPHYSQAPQTLSSIDQWNDLYFQTFALLNSDPITTPLHTTLQSNLTALHEARLSTIATRLPIRGQMSAQEWMAVLQREQESLWSELDGKGKRKGKEGDEIIEARKRDYDEVLRREIALAVREV